MGQRSRGTCQGKFNRGSDDIIFFFTMVINSALSSTLRLIPFPLARGTVSIGTGGKGWDLYFGCYCKPRDCHGDIVNAAIGWLIVLRRLIAAMTCGDHEWYEDIKENMADYHRAGVARLPQIAWKAGKWSGLGR
jgi:hypothetical protein